MDGLRDDELKRTFFISNFVGLARFCESIVDYVANAENAPYPDISVDRFYGEISSAYDILFNVWIKANESKVHTTVRTYNIWITRDKVFCYLEICLKLKRH